MICIILVALLSIIEIKKLYYRITYYRAAQWMADGSQNWLVLLWTISTLGNVIAEVVT